MQQWKQHRHTHLIQDAFADYLIYQVNIRVFMALYPYMHLYYGIAATEFYYKFLFTWPLHS